MFQGTLTISSGHTPPPIIELQPNDVLIVQSPLPLHKEHSKFIAEGIKKHFPGHKVIILSHGNTFHAIRPNQTDSIPQ